MEGLGNRVNSARVKRMAAQDAPKRQKPALQSAKTFDCLQRVGRTGGIKSAGGYSFEFRQVFPVHPDHPKHPFFDHFP